MKSFIAHIQSLYPISQMAAEDLLSICTEIHCKKNTIVQPIGHTCRTIYYINKGALRVFYFKGETDITESLEFEHAFVARVESLVTGEPSRKGIQAVEDTTLLAINADRLEDLYNQHLDLERLFRKIFLSSFITTLKRIEDIQFQSAEERYTQFLREHPDVLRRIPLKYIASYLGITQVSLSRIRAKL